MNRSGRSLCGYGVLVFCVCAVGLVVPTVFAQALDPAGLARKRQIQEQLRARARQTVVRLLDDQLAQLEDNQLEKHPWYQEIRFLRGKVDQLTEKEMADLIALLDQIAQLSQGQKKEAFVAVRSKSRNVLLELVIQHHLLLQRLRISELAEQVRRLIELETGVWKSCRTLAEQPTGQEDLALAAQENQRDTQTLYLQMKDLLVKFASWGGSAGAEADRAVKLLQEHRADDHLAAVLTKLEALKFAEAQNHAETTIDILRKLLERIERVRGLVAEEQSNLREKVQELLDRQQELRQQTAQSDLASAKAEQLAQEQNALRRELHELRRQLPEESPAAKPLQQAEQAAEDAAGELFEAKREEALAQQEQVLKNLQEAARNLPESAEHPQQAASPEDLAELERALQEAKKELNALQKAQQEVSDQAAAEPAKAKSAEAEIAQRLDKLGKLEPLPPRVESAIERAEQKAQEAAQTMDRSTPAAQRQAAAEKAHQAIQQAQAEVEHALQQADHQAQTAKAQALAQAAQNLQQLAEQERQLAQEAQKAAQTEGASADQAKQMAHEQDQIEAQARQAAQQAANVAPEAAKAVEQARPD
ncbi:MAG TPA: DUF4175 family protein, partial [Thermoguttaceae bacterium]|nr:DUF4175 family protein [Thermoguttaceae bacterium]